MHTFGKPLQFNNKSLIMLAGFVGHKRSVISFPSIF